MSTTRKIITRKVWNGRRMQEQKGTLHPFRPGVKLFKSETGGKWWLHYSEHSLTGHFTSKAGAIRWWTNGGR